ncbi:hypothetical protein GCM10022291_11560 [Postechiella marina]|uniref:DUF2975 domain-containing protein n=1 Tax=Postechiella marina TaxID=943941 RepID=A0ABP8C4W1_9FLAO
MKMFGTKSLSSYLFTLSRVVSVLILLLALFIIISILTNNMALLDGRFAIALPVSNMEIKANYNLKTIFTISSTLVFYAGYIYLLSLIFKTFKAEKLFTKTAVKYLKYFTVLNLIVFPFSYLFIRFVVMGGVKINIPFIVLHVLVGVLSAFLIALFNNGYSVQKENDLTI